MAVQLITPEELPLPAISIEVNFAKQRGVGYLRTVRVGHSVALVRKANIALSYLPYYWAADDAWYEPVNIRNIKLVPWWLRLMWLPGDLARADFELRKMDEPPLPPDRLFRNLADSVFLSYDKRRHSTGELRKCKTCLETIEWYEKFSWHKGRY